MLKTARSYLHSSGHNTGSWRTDGQTDRIPLASTALCIARSQCGRAIKIDDEEQKLGAMMYRTNRYWGGRFDMARYRHRNDVSIFSIHRSITKWHSGHDACHVSIGPPNNALLFPSIVFSHVLLQHKHKIKPLQCA